MKIGKIAYESDIWMVVNFSPNLKLTVLITMILIKKKRVHMAVVILSFLFDTFWLL